MQVSSRSSPLPPRSRKNAWVLYIVYIPEYLTSRQGQVWLAAEYENIIAMKIETSGSAREGHDEWY